MLSRCTLEMHSRDALSRCIRDALEMRTSKLPCSATASMEALRPRPCRAALSSCVVAGRKPSWYMVYGRDSRGIRTVPFSFRSVSCTCFVCAGPPRHTVRLNPRGARQRVRRSDAIPHTPAIPRASGRKMIVPTAVSTRDLRHFGATPREGELERGSVSVTPGAGPPGARPTGVGARDPRRVVCGRHYVETPWAIGIGS